MREFTPAEIRALLEAADRHLTRPASIIIVGGSAAAFAGAASTTTSDIDTFEAIAADLERALDLARAETGLDIPCGVSTVADIPYDAEDRYQRPLPELRMLDVRILERHDLALSKALRLVDTDVAQLRELHAAAPLDLDVLVSRFCGEMGHAMGDPREHRRKFLDLVEELFGGAKRVAAERVVAERLDGDR